MTLPETMKAIVTERKGDLDVLRLKDIPVPVLGDDQVLIKVLAASINNTDINTRVGWYSEDGGWQGATPFPLIQGVDCCGLVVAGRAVIEGRFQKNQRVLIRPCMRLNGWNRSDSKWLGVDCDGSFAEYVKVPETEVFPVNSVWSDAELASIPCAFGTAENMLLRADVSSRDNIMVKGASGGVGSAVVKLAKMRGANVTAVTSHGKLDAVRKLGADTVIVRNDVDMLEDDQFSVVFDNVAGKGVLKALHLLRYGGRYISSGAVAGAVVSLDMRVLYLKDLTVMGSTLWRPDVFPNLISYIEKEQFKPDVSHIFPLEKLKQAQELFIQRKHIGKICVRISEQ